MLRSNFCDYSDKFIVVKVRINVKAIENTDVGQKDVAFKNNTLFRLCIIKINSTLIDNAEHLSIVMLMYNSWEYSQNYSITSGSLWNYYRNEIDNADDNALDCKSFQCKTKIIGKTEERPQRPAQTGPDQDTNPWPQTNQPPIPPLNTEVVFPLKYLSYFWRSLDLPLINC